MICKKCGEEKYLIDFPKVRCFYTSKVTGKKTEYRSFSKVCKKCKLKRDYERRKEKMLREYLTKKVCNTEK